MYLDHFKLIELPFTLTPNVDFFCQLKGHQEALNILLFSLRSGEGFIKIIGEVGSGKTLLCRKLLQMLDNDIMTAYIPNPDLTPYELRKALARELSVDSVNLSDQHELLTLINNKLLELHRAGKRVVLLIDEAQALSLSSLEAVRLLTNLETEKTKLLQVVLFGQPELDDRLKQPNLRQLQQRITFSYYLPFLTREDLDVYLFHRLAAAGTTLGALFTKQSKDLLFRASRGVPRLINIFCHKALLVAYGKGVMQITPEIMQNAIHDTIPIVSRKVSFFAYTVLGLLVIVGMFFAIY